MVISSNDLKTIISYFESRFGKSELGWVEPETLILQPDGEDMPYVRIDLKSGDVECEIPTFIKLVTTLQEED